MFVVQFWLQQILLFKFILYLFLEGFFT
jgi:hypothetical protein